MTDILHKYSRTWLKVFHHKIESGFFSKDRSLCLVSNENGKFNMLGNLNSRFKINGKYEFMIDYEEKGNIVWKQTLLPTEISKENTSDVLGFKVIYNKNNLTRFSGLKISHLTSNSCFDGSNFEIDNFRYSIGTIDFDPTTIPGPVNQNGNVINVNKVIVWIRVPNIIFTLKSCRYFSITKLSFIMIIVNYC